MLHEGHLGKLFCINLPLDLWVLGEVYLLDWLVILHFDMVLCCV